MLLDDHGHAGLCQLKAQMGPHQEQLLVLSAALQHVKTFS